MLTLLCFHFDLVQHMFQKNFFCYTDQEGFSKSFLLDNYRMTTVALLVGHRESWLCLVLKGYVLAYQK